VASGTSTQTSITVVETNIDNFHDLKSFITCSFSFALSLPCIIHILSFISLNIFFTSSNSVVAAFRSSIFSDSSMSGVTINTFSHLFIFSITRSLNLLS
jgi:hypothetical protein